MRPGEWIKSERKRAGMTQAELAKRIGVESATITRYERGQREPSFDQLQKIAEALNVSSITTFGSDERGLYAFNDSIDEYEEEIIKKMRKLNPFGKRWLLSMIDSVLLEPMFLKEQDVPPVETGEHEEKDG